jgi:hypothetical protein
MFLYYILQKCQFIKLHLSQLTPLFQCLKANDNYFARASQDFAPAILCLWWLKEIKNCICCWDGLQWHKFRKSCRESRSGVLKIVVGREEGRLFRRKQAECWFHKLTCLSFSRRNFDSPYIGNYCKRGHMKSSIWLGRSFNIC